MTQSVDRFSGHLTQVFLPARGRHPPAWFEQQQQCKLCQYNVDIREWSGRDFSDGELGVGSGSFSTLPADLYVRFAPSATAGEE
jgi:hypothetical protein